MTNLREKYPELAAELETWYKVHEPQISSEMLEKVVNDCLIAHHQKIGGFVKSE
jgi:hypothetical protein